MKIKTLIADDEPLAREKLRTLLDKDADIDLVAECSDGTETIAAIKKYSPELVFLDVQMPELDGFGVLESMDVSNGAPNIIFVTAYDQYALKAFEFHALDYLLKPFDRERFQKALRRAKTHIRKEKSGEVNEKLLALLEDLKTGGQNHNSKYLERLVIKSAGRVIFLKIDEIDWIEAAGNYVRLHIGKESHLLRDTMNGIEAKLNPDEFLRIHRSTIIRIDRIKELQPWVQGEYVLTLQNGAQLTSSRSYRQRLSEFMANSF